MHASSSSQEKRTPRVIALTTDFGLDDPFVGVMKGVILGICPEVRLVDLTHAVPAQDVLAGCLALESTGGYFPPGTIHVAVVDPGVGTDRAALAVRTSRATYLAPDNGLLSFLREDEVLEIRHVENPGVCLQPVSKTFHGRDVFAPAAAHLACGAPLDTLGPATPSFRRLTVPAAITAPGETRGELLTFDRFGNAVTSIRESDVPNAATQVIVKGHHVPLVVTYGAVSQGLPLGLVGSSGRVEISIREGNARAELQLQRGDPVVVRS